MTSPARRNNGTPVAGQQFEYTFDDISNRTMTAEGGELNCRVRE